jgi:trans-aconitate 2-methyltransferase
MPTAAGAGAGWDPARYLRFADQRLRPAADLLARVPLAAPARVVDLGCGSGAATRLLAGRWPDAAVTGVDSSAPMLARARAEGPAAAWIEADLATWRPAATVDLVYSNAALQWLDHHETVVPALLDHLAPGGALAVQMPRNHGAASHTAMAETVAAGPWAERLRSLLRPSPVAEPAWYHDLLAPRAAVVDIWETVYNHVLEGEDPVVQWTIGTALKPLVDALDEAERPAFLADYAARVRDAYPPGPDGRTLFPFRRLFWVAMR